MSQALARSSALLAVGFAAIIAAPRSARAEDERADSLTVQPLTGVSVAASSRETRAVLDVTQLNRLTLFSLRASVPLDSDTRLTEFVDEGQMTSGFAASLLAGLDQRAWVLKQADERMARIARAVEVLRTPPLNMDLRSAFVKKHGLANDANAIARFFCDAQAPSDAAADDAPTASPASPASSAASPASSAASPAASPGPCEMTAHVPRGVCAALGRPCDEAFDLGAAASEASRAIIGGAACAGFIEGRDIDRCFAASWWLFVHEREVNSRKIAVYFREPGSVEKTWETLVAVDAERASALLAASGGGKASALIDNRDEVIGALRAAYRTTALERRDLLATGLATTRFDLYSVLFDASLGYDRFDVIASDSASPVSVERSRIALGVNYTKYLRNSPGLAINLRGGFEHSQRSGAMVPNCGVFDPRLPGTCDEDQPVLIEDTPDDVSSVYARGALTYQWRRQLATNSWIPGVEVRGGFENVGQGAVATLRPTLFATALRGPLAVRAGVSFDLAYQVDEDAVDEARRSRWQVAPMFVLGVNFPGLPLLGAN